MTTTFRERIEGMTAGPYEKALMQDCAGTFRLSPLDHRRPEGGLSEEDADGLLLSVALTRLIASDEAVEMVARLCYVPTIDAIDNWEHAREFAEELPRSDTGECVQAALVRAKAILDFLQQQSLAAAGMEKARGGDSEE